LLNNWYLPAKFRAWGQTTLGNIVFSKRQRSGRIIDTFLVNFLCTRIGYQRPAYMETTKQIPKKDYFAVKTKSPHL
jgi:hypothetical protein